MLDNVDIYSNVSQSLKPIYEAHWETGNEVNSKSGAAIMKAQRVAMNKKQTHWHTAYVKVKQGKNKGKTVRRFVYNERITRSIGDIVNKKAVMLDTRLDNLIQFRTYSTKGTTVVTAPMKSGKTEIRKDGKIVSSKRVDSIGQGSINILQKLNYGLNNNSNKVNRVGNQFSWQGKQSHENFKGTHTNPMNFIEEGRRNAMSDVNKYITRGFQDALSRRTPAKVKPIKVA